MSPTVSEAFAIDRLRDTLSGREPGALGGRLEFHARLGSTSDRARDLAASGEPHGTIVIADEQVSGRGRGGRSWHSPGRLGIYLSCILRPDAPPEQAPLAGLVAAVACREAAASFLSGEGTVRLKWPNDVVSGRRKLAGILPESRTSQEGIRDIVLGVGLNVNHATEDFPEDLRARATSLRLLAGAPLDRVAVAARLVTALDQWYNVWVREGGEAITRAYAAHNPDLAGRRVRVNDRGGSWEGITEGIAPDGALCVRREDGGRIAVRFGEVGRVEEI
jgi:BirA family biotin operon repressor/biotin-[acetyl-CoA-carboxylase] ligase